MNEQREVGLRCRCGLIVPREKMVDFLCPECRLARILTEYDRPSPDCVGMSFPGRSYRLFTARGQDLP